MLRILEGGFYSEAYELKEGTTAKYANWESTGGIRTSVKISVRFADTKEELGTKEWSREYDANEEFSAVCRGKYMQYRLNLIAKSGCGTPRITAVRVYFD